MSCGLTLAWPELRFGALPSWGEPLGAVIMLRIMLGLVAVAVFAPSAAALEINWTRLREISRKGPFSVELRNKITMRVPTGFRFFGEDKLADFHGLLGDAALADEAGALLTEEGGWVAVILIPKENPLAGLDPKLLDSAEPKAQLLKWNEALVATAASRRAALQLPMQRITGWTHTPTYDSEKKRLTMGVRVADDGSHAKRDHVYFCTIIYGPNPADMVAVVTQTNINSWDKPLEESRKLGDEFTFATVEAAAPESETSEAVYHYGKIAGAGLIGVVAVFLLARATGPRSPQAPSRPPARRFGTPR
jgi:uncharacterized membrane-anchored protein